MTLRRWRPIAEAEEKIIRRLAAESGLIHGAEAAKAGIPINAINVGTLAQRALDAYLQHAGPAEQAEALSQLHLWNTGFATGYTHGYKALEA